MKFAEPIWLLVGVVACAVLVWRYRQYDRRQRAALSQFASSHLLDQLTVSVSVVRRKIKRGLILLGTACLFVALARPQAGFRWEEIKRKGLDILIAVDTSKSMLTEDVKPSRLARAKLAVQDLVSKTGGDRVGLVAFAGSAFLQCPLTLDQDAFRQSLDALDTSIIPRGGTDIARAIRQAEAALRSEGNNHKILVMITDGEDLQGSALRAAREAAKQGLRIFTVGVGTAQGGLIPVSGENGGVQFKKDASDQFVKSRLDAPLLRQIAEATGGFYAPLGGQGEGLETIYQQGLAHLTKHELASRMQKVSLEQFAWPLALGLCCLLLEPLIGTRKRPLLVREPLRSGPVQRRQPRLGVAAAAIVLLAMPAVARASAQSAEKLFRRGEYAVAEQQYQQAAEQQPQKPELHFNLGASAYKNGHFDIAAAAFQKTLKTDRIPLQEDTYYNLGNTHYRLGQKTEATNPQQTIQTWQHAIQSFDAALQLNPKDNDARFNRDFVKKRLQQLQKQQPPHPTKQAGQTQQSQTPSQPQEQANSGRQAQPPPTSSSKRPDEPPPAAKAGQDDLKPRSPQPQASASDQKPEKQQGGEAERPPGQMTKEEAKDLLDSLRSTERRMPLSPDARDESGTQEPEPLKDW